MSEQQGPLGFALAASITFGTATGIIASYKGPPAISQMQDSVGVPTGALVGIAAGMILGWRAYSRILGIIAYGLAVGVSGYLTNTSDNSFSLGALIFYTFIYGLGIAMAVALPQGWGSFTLSRLWLAARDEIPFDLVTFLEDAHDRGVLRQSGAFYQFRHPRLQDRLADRYERGMSSADQGPHHRSPATSVT